MIVSHSHRFIFVKSEKTAGTSVEAALSKFCVDRDVVTPLGDYWFNRGPEGEWLHNAMNADGFSQHDSAAEIRRKVGSEAWDAYFKFSIARNPWDRVVSNFSWEARNKPALRPVKRWYHRLGAPYDEFQETKRLFHGFVAGEWTTNDRFYVADGALCVDFVMRYERLADDLAEVCRHIGVPPVELPHLKSGLRKAGRRYADYYDDSSRAIVAERHHHDLRLFGYEF
jgi:hypothetical protein